MSRKKIKRIIKNTGGHPLVKAIPNYAKTSIPFSALIIALGIISYISLASLTVWNANKRTSYEKELQQKTTAVIELESKLSLINKKITRNLAMDRGFIETHSVKYINIQPPTTASRSNETKL